MARDRRLGGGMEYTFVIIIYLYGIVQIAVIC